jgi:hypothetical protein
MTGATDPDIECILEPLSPAGGEGRVRGFQDALIVPVPNGCVAEPYSRFVSWGGVNARPEGFAPVVR